TINGTAYDFAGIAPASTVSVGAAGRERTITNVAAGRLAEKSTGGVNGPQLNATNQALEAVRPSHSARAQRPPMRARSHWARAP
ncbi:hypothetical protein G3N99_21385, partial [Burkholderia sp. Ac-20392]|nr:hypothetical protein [Burkholderia sp. Ac-20392]